MGEYMRQTLALVCVIAVVTLTIGCSGCSDTKDGTAGDAGRADFDQRMSVADSLYNSMQFRDAYDLYLQLLNHPVADFIRDCRLEHACQLLKTTDMPIAKVAAAQAAVEE